MMPKKERDSGWLIWYKNILDMGTFQSLLRDIVGIVISVLILFVSPGPVAKSAAGVAFILCLLSIELSNEILYIQAAGGDGAVPVWERCISWMNRAAILFIVIAMLFFIGGM